MGAWEKRQMRNQVFAVAVLTFIGGTYASFGADNTQMPWNTILNSPPAGKFAAMAAEALQREMLDDRFVLDDGFLRHGPFLMAPKNQSQWVQCHIRC